jgi:hypothetical protein
MNDKLLDRKTPETPEEKINAENKKAASKEIANKNRKREEKRAEDMTKYEKGLKTFYKAKDEAAEDDKATKAKAAREKEKAIKAEKLRELASKRNKGWGVVRVDKVDIGRFFDDVGITKELNKKTGEMEYKIPKGSVHRVNENIRKTPLYKKYGKARKALNYGKTSKRKTSKRKTSKRKTSKRKTSKRKTSKRKTSKRKTSKRKTSKRKTSKR